MKIVDPYVGLQASCSGSGIPVHTKEELLYHSSSFFVWIYSTYIEVYQTAGVFNEEGTYYFIAAAHFQAQ